MALEGNCRLLAGEGGAVAIKAVAECWQELVLLPGGKGHPKSVWWAGKAVWSVGTLGRKPDGYDSKMAATILADTIHS